MRSWIAALVLATGAWLMPTGSAAQPAMPWVTSWAASALGSGEDGEDVGVVDDADVGDVVVGGADDLGCAVACGQRLRIDLHHGQGLRRALGQRRSCIHDEAHGEGAI